MHKPNDDRATEALVKMEYHFKEMKDVVAEMSKNIRQINDANILHHAETSKDHKKFEELILIVVNKGFWVFIVVLGLLMIALGYSEVTKFLGWGI
jgi:hypothetical protein